MFWIVLALSVSAGGFAGAIITMKLMHRAEMERYNRMIESYRGLVEAYRDLSIGIAKNLGVTPPKVESKLPPN